MSISDKTKLSQGQKSLINYLRQPFTDVEEAIKSNCEDGRLKSIALTKLEEAWMFATRAIVKEG